MSMSKRIAVASLLIAFPPIVAGLIFDSNAGPGLCAGVMFVSFVAVIIGLVMLATMNWGVRTMKKRSVSEKESTITSVELDALVNNGVIQSYEYDTILDTNLNGDNIEYEELIIEFEDGTRLAIRADNRCLEISPV